MNLSITDELAEYIDDFITDNNDNVNNERIILSERLLIDGVIFLDAIKEMMNQTADGALNENTNTNNKMYEDDDDESWDVPAPKKKKKISNTRGTGLNMDGSRRCSGIDIDDAMERINEGFLDGLSDARKKAWRNRRTNPEAFFYRFNAPGQAAKKGKWREEEHKMFMERVMELGVNEGWYELYRLFQSNS